MRRRSRAPRYGAGPRGSSRAGVARATATRAAADPRDTVEILRGAGAAVVVAHPVQMKLDDETLLETLRRLRDWGAVGLEVYSSYHTPEQCRTYRRMARTLDMVITGGSDYHGTGKPGISLGSLGVPGLRLQYDEVVVPLLARVG